MTGKMKVPTQREVTQSAAEARREMMERRGVVPLWKVPREFLPRMTEIFPEPADLWSAACEYFQWSENNDIEFSIEIGRNTGQFVKVKKPRPYHIRSFKAFLGITPKIWERLLSREEFREVIDQIEHIIYTQKFDNGMVGVFDAGMTAKDLGLADKREVTSDITAQVSEVSARDILLSRLKKSDDA